MVELLRTNDFVLLSYLSALLAEAAVDAVILDEYTSIVEGSIGAIPRRLMVTSEDAVRARALLSEAGIACAT
jgi:hypothetical protein